jgi:hypothetical protein
MKISTRKTALAVGSALMLFATTLNAQEQPWSFGVKAGGSMSWLGGFDKLAEEKVNGSDMNNKASGNLFLTGGLTAGYAFHENVGVGVEVLYAGLGGELEASKKLGEKATDNEKKNNKPFKTKIHSNNIVVPVMLKLFPLGCDPDEGILTIDLGAQGVFPLSVSVTRSKKDKDGVAEEGLEEFKDKASKAFDKSKQVSPFTLDGIAGMSYEFPEIGLTVEARYHYGFMNFFKSDDEAKKYRKDEMGFEADKNVNNHYATVSVGYNLARLLMD